MLSFTTVGNLVAVKWKLENKRFADAIVDTLVLIALAYVFGGTLGGLTIATTTSFIFSIYLFFSPPKLPKMPTRQQRKKNWRHSTNL